MSRVLHAPLRRTSALFLLILGCAQGCRDRDTVAPVSPSIAGRWSGSGMAGTVRFHATFTQSGEIVGGTGEVDSIYGTDQFTISGTLRGREVQLTLETTGNVMSVYTGRFTGANTIDGRLNPPDVALRIQRDD